MTPLLDAFTQKYGIKVKIWKSSSENILQRVIIADLVSKKVPGRQSDDHITIFANGGHGWGQDGDPGHGIQFTAMAKLIYDLAKERGVGRQLPLEWFQQDINS